MTRLQIMFLQLSKYKTVNELESGMSKQFVDDILARVAFDKNGTVHTCKYFKTCDDCVINCPNVYPLKATLDYLDTEVNDIQSENNSISIMQKKALNELQEKFNIARKEKLNPLVTAKLLDSYCEILENIGLFEPYKCHDILLRITKEKHK